jgi:hypothetical protein
MLRLLIGEPTGLAWRMARHSARAGRCLESCRRMLLHGKAQPVGHAGGLLPEVSPVLLAL